MVSKSYYIDSNYVHLWIHLLFKANIEESLFYGKTIKRGQIVTSRNKLAYETGVQASKVERVLKVFKNEQQIEQQNCGRYRIITICNYEDYQNLNNVEKTGEQRANNGRTHNKNNKNIRNKEIYIEAEKIIDFLNKKAGRNFEKSKTSMKQIIARLKEGADPVIMRKVISLKLQNPFFLEKDLIRPSTLYNRTNYENYAEEVRTYEKSINP